MFKYWAVLYVCALFLRHCDCWTGDIFIGVLYIRTAKLAGYNDSQLHVQLHVHVPRVRNKYIILMGVRNSVN